MAAPTPLNGKALDGRIRMDCTRKDDQVVAALSRLREAFGTDRILVVDDWPADPFAVGVETPGAPGLLAYLSVYGSEDWYVALELAPGPEEAAADLPYRDGGSHSGVAIDDVVEIVGRHLNLLRAG